MIRIFSFLCLLFPVAALAQIPTGEWRMHIANKAIDIASGNGQVFAALETGLLEYDINAKEASLWTDVNSLSDIQVSCIYYHPESTSFFVGYKNGNIDRIQNNTVTNIPALKLAQVQGDKRVYAFKSSGNLVYCASGIGIVVLNSDNNEVKDTYYPNSSMEAIEDVSFTTDSIYALTKTKLWAGSISSQALADPAQWKVSSYLPVLTASTQSYQELMTVNDQLYVHKQNEAFAQDTVYRITSSGLVPAFNLTFDVQIESVVKDGNHVLLTLWDGILMYDLNFQLELVYNDFKGIGNYLVQAATVVDNAVFAADFNNGIFHFSQEGLSTIQVSGPPRNSFYALGGTKDKVAVAGGVINKTSFEFNVDGAYVFDDEEWSHFNYTNQSILNGKSVFDFSAVSISPVDDKKIAMSTYSEVPLMIVEDGTKITKIFDTSNSEIDQPTGATYTCISDVEYDSKGNLWMVNCFTVNPLKVYTKDEQWYEFSLGAAAQSKFTSRMIVDQSGNKWVAVMDVGLFGFSDGGTISDASDDQLVELNDGTSSGALPDANVTAIAVDLDNEIWIGTPAGFAVLYNPDNAFGAAAGEYNAQRIKIEFEGNVEYVLGNTSITDIEVDGGNRKWMGTANAGIFLLSADGGEVLAAYTTENSPLISNNIVDMEFNDKTGELFVITDIGMVSLRTDASKGDDQYADVTVFPNPVKPGFDGFITMQGIKEDSDVKVTDIAGNVVFQTTSNGGTATWNGKTLNGEKVKAGTYLIWTASNTEKGRKVGKVVVLN